jgi:serine/threonine-protein kinase
MTDTPHNGARTQTVSPPLGAGKTLKHYRLEATIGEGGMGLVYRGRDTKLNRTVAVKILTPSLTADPEKKRRLLQEARAAASIAHPAIAQAFDADEQEGVTFIIMELVAGKTVRELIRNHELKF